MSVIHRIVFDMINKQKSVFDPKHWPDYQKRRENEAGQTSALKPPKGVEICPDTLAGVPVEWVSCEKGSNDILMLYIHGGGFVGGSAEANRVFTGYCAKEWGWKALAVNYRLAPEHPFPAGLEDCLAVYRELLKNYDAERIVFCGGSAGGNLVLALELMARDQGLPAPAAILSASSLSAKCSRGADSATSSQ